MTQELRRFCPNCGSAVKVDQEACAKCNASLANRFATLADEVVNRLPAESSPEAKQATAMLVASLPPKRRTLLKGAVAAAGGLALVGMSSLYAPRLTQAAVAQAVHKQAATKHEQKAVTASTQSTQHTARALQDSIVSILTVARTAEQLAVTFYSNGVNNASQLGLSGQNLEYVKAALVEEQIHQQFFAANGGQSLAATFSFPEGSKTFSDLKTFIATQQQLEGVFDSAFLAAIVEFAQLGRPDLAQIAGQVACIEAEHRALGRAIGNLSPADNWAFTPVLIGAVGDAPALVQKAGYLSPASGNSYTYQQVSTSYPGVEQTKPFAEKQTIGNG